jgi:hypothetical protein
MASPIAGLSPRAKTIAPTNSMMPNICKINPPGSVGFGMALPLLSSVVMSLSALKLAFSKIQFITSP